MWFNSFRFQLLTGLLVPLTAVALLQMWVAYETANATARDVTDRLLLASARIFAEHMSFDEGRIESLVPPSALGMFDLGYGDRVYYRVSTSQGRLLAGYEDLAAAIPANLSERERYADGRFDGQPIRLVSVSQPIPTPTKTLRGIVVVAETLRGESAMRTALMLQSSRQEALLVLVALAGALFMLRRALSPILNLSDEVEARHPSEYRPFAAASLQRELRPLERALNRYMRRLESQVEVQRRFTANAAHQLRTPLTLLRTQASYAMRGSENERADAIHAILVTTRQLARLTNQLLALARLESRPDSPRRENVDLALVVREILEEHAPLAIDRGLDLSFDTPPGESAPVVGDPAQLRDLIVNLIDNAIRYTPSPGHIEVTVGAEADRCSLRIQDSGPGIPLEEQKLVFERFYRAREGASEGSGLGLAIVKEIVDSLGAAIELRQRVPGPGLTVEVRFRTAAPARFLGADVAEGRRPPFQQAIFERRE